MAEVIFHNKEEIINFFDIASKQYIHKIEEVLVSYTINLKYENNYIDFVLSDNLNNKQHTIKLLYDGIFHLWCNADINDTACNFHQGNSLYEVDVNNKSYKVCKHILALCKQYREDIQYMLDDIISGYSQKEYTYKPIEEFQQLKRFAFKIPVLLEGDRGSGKTYEVFNYAKSLGIEPSFVGGHAGIESIDLLGCLVPYQNNTQIINDTEISAETFFSGDYSMNISYQNNSGLVWKDGPIAEAFRKAQKGEKSILIIDELLRISQRELNILLTALSPVNNQYHIRTGRVLEVIDGVAKEEILSCDVNNLFVLATTNTGGQYAVDTIDPALAERFIIIRKDTEYDQLVYVLKSKAREKGFNENLADKTGIFFNRMLSAKEQGIVEECPTLRTLSRAFDLANEESEVKDFILDQYLLWVARDVYGKPDKVQIDCIQKILKEVF